MHNKHNVAPRHHRAMLRTGLPKQEKYEYEVVDPHHQPDLKGESLSGAKPYWKRGKHHVRLTPLEAQFYLTNGALRRVTDA